MTVSDVRGCGGQPDPRSPTVAPGVASILGNGEGGGRAEDGRVPALLHLLERVSRTQGADDGKVFVLPVDDAVRIRTGERGRDAL
jgi:nitrogen regulatory protein PII